MKLCFTRQELADYFGCDRKTLYNKIRKANLEVERGFISLDKIHSICENLGYPKPFVNEKGLKLPIKIS